MNISNQIHHLVVKYLESNPDYPLEKEQIVKLVRDIMQKNAQITPDEAQKIIEQIADRIVGLGPLENLLRDSDITEIMVNGMHSVFVEKNGKLEKTNAQFANEEEILNIINRIVNKVGRRVDESSPLVDARLPDGSRVNAIIAPLSLSGPILTIRRFPPEPFTLEKLVALQTLTSQMAEFLQNAIRTKQNIVISGGAGVGKTTTLNAIASTIPHTERLIIIEDAAEMRLQHPHLVSLETRPPNIEGKGEIPMRILVKNALRMRPDRIIIGEIRGGEALDMLQAMNTGHKGSLTTVHANTPLDALMRVETMALMADIDLPLFAIQEQIKSAINIIVQQERTSTGERRITKICELQNVPSANVRQRYTLKELF